MADLPVPGKERSPKGDIGPGLKAVVGLASAVLQAAPPGPDVRQQLQTMLKHAADLRARSAFTTPEYEQLRAILLVALRRLDETAARGERPQKRDAKTEDDVVDAVAVNADPNDPDILDGIDLFLDERGQDTDVLDAVEFEGDLDGDDVLDALDLPDEGADDVLDAVDLGDVDDAEAMDAETIEDFAGGEEFANDLDIEMVEDAREDVAELADEDIVAVDSGGAEDVIFEDTGLDLGGDSGGDGGFSFGSSDDSE